MKEEDWISDFPSEDFFQFPNEADLLVEIPCHQDNSWLQHDTPSCHSDYCLSQSLLDDCDDFLGLYSHQDENGIQQPDELWEQGTSALSCYSDFSLDEAHQLVDPDSLYPDGYEDDSWVSAPQQFQATIANLVPPKVR